MAPGFPWYNKGMYPSLSGFERIVLALVVSTLVSIGLYSIGVIRNHSFDFWYLAFNLLLALIPLLLAVWLQYRLRKQAWKRWLPLVVTFLWVLFLPNSFYIVTDFIHLTETPRVDIVQDVVMLIQFSFTGLAFGFISLFILHREFMRRVSARWAPALVAAILLLCSFAIYLGRDLRWNSWDIIVQPLPLIADLLRHLLDPFAYPQAFIITCSFFAMLCTMYALIWQVGKSLLSAK